MAAQARLIFQVDDQELESITRAEKGKGFAPGILK
jgi:hypothetical protein